MTSERSFDSAQLAALIGRRLESGDFAFDEFGVLEAPTQATAYGQTEQVSVFLSHASEDKPMVRKLYLRLVASGYDVWYDERILLPGQDWEHEIRRAVIASDTFITVISHNSVNKSGFIREELRLALDIAEERSAGAIFIIPLRIDTVDIPDRLKKWHVLDTSAQHWFNLLVRSLNTRAGSA